LDGTARGVDWAAGSAVVSWPSEFSWPIPPQPVRANMPNTSVTVLEVRLRKKLFVVDLLFIRFLVI
jgi:hypothetical protein